MNADTLRRLQARNLSVAQLKALAAAAVDRCARNNATASSESALAYARTCADYARQLAGAPPAKRWAALEACLRYCEASQRVQAAAAMLAREEKWLEETARPYLEKLTARAGRPGRRP
jgi:hypothetical protein